MRKLLLKLCKVAHVSGWFSLRHSGFANPLCRLNGPLGWICFASKDPSSSQGSRYRIYAHPLLHGFHPLMLPWLLPLGNRWETQSHDAHRSSSYCGHILLIKCREVHSVAFIITLDCFIVIFFWVYAVQNKARYVCQVLFWQVSLACRASTVSVRKVLQWGVVPLALVTQVRGVNSAFWW